MHFLQNKTFVDEIMQGTDSAKAYKVFDDFEAFWQSESLNHFV